MNISRLQRDYVEELNSGVSPWEISLGSHTYLNWRCADCTHVWSAAVYNRVGGNTNCPRCIGMLKESKGSTSCALYFDSLRDNDGAPVAVIEDRVLGCRCGKPDECKSFLPHTIYLPNRRYDYIFMYKGRKFVVEFDGSQHFKRSGWHGTREKFLRNQQIDKVKNLAALLAGFTIVRLSDVDPLMVRKVLNYFLNLEGSAPFLGVDDVKKYAHMFTHPSDETTRKYFPLYPTVATAATSPVFSTIALRMTPTLLIHKTITMEEEAGDTPAPITP